jgi:hypothetical protein
MIAQIFTAKFLASSWDVLLLFTIPIGGGIPGGVILAQQRGLAWPIMMVLYCISDVILACVFEPLLLLFVRASKNNPKLARIREVISQATNKTVSQYGINPGPFSLIMITFGTDPMTGRSIAFAAGHGFLTGWILTIIGDMLFFTVIMASTLWLNNLLGSGTLTAVIIMVAMIALPALYRKWKSA